MRFRFGRYRVDLAILLAWFLAVPLGGALAYGVLLAVTKMLSLVAPHISLSLNAWFSTTVAYLLPATATMAAAVICMLIPVFTSHQPSPPADAEAFGHAIIPQGIANATWVLVYSSMWVILAAYPPNSPSRSCIAARSSAFLGRNVDSRAFPPLPISHPARQRHPATRDSVSPVTYGDPA